MKNLKNNIWTLFKNLIEFGSPNEYEYQPDVKQQKFEEDTLASPLLSRDLSWIKFNERVLAQVQRKELNIFEKFKFMAITASNLDEFLTVRLGSLYNYLDYNKERVDYSGLRENTFRKVILSKIKKFIDDRNAIFKEQLRPLFKENGFNIIKWDQLKSEKKQELVHYFDQLVYPLLTPMVYDATHVFPILLPKHLILAVVTYEKQTNLFPENEENKKFSFVQIPSNLPKFLEIEESSSILFLPIEELVRSQIHKLYRNVEIESIDLIRIIRNGDFTIDENDDADVDFVDEVREKIRGRQAGRIVALTIEDNPSVFMMETLKKKWDIDKYNIHINKELMDYTRLFQIINHPEFKDKLTALPPCVATQHMNRDLSIFENIKEKDILLHHPYNSFEPVLQLIEKAAEDPNVLSLKLTIYRVAKKSRITSALLKAVQNGKHVAVLFEIKARFDEENNIKEAERLQKAGCFVIHGIGSLKTHTKLLLITRKEGDSVVQYAHMASGNYNEETSKIYTDIGLLTTNKSYTQDIAEFFNAITGHSLPDSYQNLIAAPIGMRNEIKALIQNEANNAERGIPAAICFKINSLEDKEIIEELYFASEKGVRIDLIVRGICCLKPQRADLSSNIRVRSIVGNLLEHARIFYFHNDGNPKVFGGSADVMVRSFERRIESLFEILDESPRQRLIHVLNVNLRENVNAYELLENGDYRKVEASHDEPVVNIHQYFFVPGNLNIMEKEIISI